MQKVVGEGRDMRETESQRMKKLKNKSGTSRVLVKPEELENYGCQKYFFI